MHLAVYYIGSQFADSSVWLLGAKDFPNKMQGFWWEEPLREFFSVDYCRPFLHKRVGAVRQKAGADPFALLIEQHRLLLSLLDKMEQTTPEQGWKRMRLFLRLKRTLGKHALAEEDVVYPLLHNQAHHEQDTKHLYQEHADMKILLYELEANPTGAEWVENVRRLRGLIEPHARQEEEVEFPKLREILNEQSQMKLSGQIHREEAMLL